MKWWERIIACICFVVVIAFTFTALYFMPEDVRKCIMVAQPQSWCWAKHLTADELPKAPE